MLDLVQGCFGVCALEKEMLSVSAGSSGTTLVLPHSEKREERGQLGKRADMSRNKPVIA